MGRAKSSVSQREVKAFLRFARKNPIVAGVIVLVIIGLFIYSSFFAGDNTPAAITEGELSVCFIDVGQGDSALVSCDGEHMLIDGGDVGAGDEILACLEKNGVHKLKYLVCTHAHADHCGGLDDVVSAVPVDTLFCSPYGEVKKAYSIFLDAAAEAGLSPEAPEMSASYSLGEASFRFIGPIRDYDNINDTSLVLRLEHGESSFLFTGDMTRVAESELLEEGLISPCDVLKVGHHGSSESSSYRFIYELEPKIAVISCGADNRYGHPHKEAVSRLSDADTKILRTDILGDIYLISDGSTVCELPSKS